MTDNPLAREQLIGSNIYLIVCRPRILVGQDGFGLDGEVLYGTLLVGREGEWHKVPFRYKLQFEHHLGRPDCCEVVVLPAGTHVLVKNERAEALIAAHVIVSLADCDLRDEERDLHVLYVGQGVGKNQQRLAVDRLSSHSTLQRILADFHTLHPAMEILILLYRFEHTRKLYSSGGDLTLAPQATEQEEKEHFYKLEQSVFERRRRITLAEAALINYFKPTYNDVFKNTNFAMPKRLKFLESLVHQDMVGLIVEVSASNMRARLYSEYQSPSNLDAESLEKMKVFIKDVDRCTNEMRADLEHQIRTHVISIPLSSAGERDSFLHGTRWHGGDDRQPHL